jgi:hypothetical protein
MEDLPTDEIPGCGDLSLAGRQDGGLIEAETGINVSVSHLMIKSHYLSIFEVNHERTRSGGCRLALCKC